MTCPRSHSWKEAETRFSGTHLLPQLTTRQEVQLALPPPPLFRYGGQCLTLGEEGVPGLPGVQERTWLDPPQGLPTVP